MQNKKIIDLHVHSHFSIPSSSLMNVKNIISFAKIKGINVIGTGDILFKPWLSEILEETHEESSGFFSRNDISFILSAELCISFRMDNKNRKFHLIITFPNIKTLIEFKKTFEKESNFEVSPRPTIHLKPKLFLKKISEISSEIFVIPAHIFTPWYGLLGMKCGFSSIEECFEEESYRIFALETGLSADPVLAYSIKELKRFIMVSFSDAHSPMHLGREAIVIKEARNYKEIFNSFLENTGNFIMTIENFPQLGKYFSTGHRKCKNKIDSFSTNNVKCNICGEKLTIGVKDRIIQLGGSLESSYTRFPFIHTLSLPELYKVCSKITRKYSINRLYEIVLSEFKSEIEFVAFSSIEKIKDVFGEELARCIYLIRNERIDFESGYDGIYGKIRLSESFGEKDN